MGRKPEQKDKRDVPGPGNYEPSVTAVKDKVRGFNFGKAPKQAQLNSSKSEAAFLGPGAYHKNEDFGKTGPKISLRGRPE